jgi:Tol biopolymer transport system component
VKSTDGAGREELLLKDSQVKSPNDWSPDGRWLLYRINDSASGADLWALPLEGEKKPVPVVRTEFNERDGQFSPDGKWIAYQSDESGRFEIYVQPFLGPGEKWQVSTNGGAQVRWRKDGKEIFYLGLDATLMAVPFTTSGDGKRVEPERPVPLFATRVRGGPVQTSGSQ